MDPNMFKGLEKAFVALACLAALLVPLGIWKMVDILFWIVQHVRR